MPNTNPPENFPGNPDLAKRRAALHWSQRDVAHNLGVGRATICHAERGGRPVSADTLARYAALLDRLERAAWGLRVVGVGEAS